VITVQIGVLIALAGILFGWGISWGLMRGELSSLRAMIHEWRRTDDRLHADHEDRLRELEAAR